METACVLRIQVPPGVDGVCVEASARASGAQEVPGLIAPTHETPCA